MIFLQNSK